MLSAQGNVEIPGPVIRGLPADHYEHVGLSKIVLEAPAPTASYQLKDWLRLMIAGHEQELITPDEIKVFSEVYATVDKCQFILRQIGTREENMHRMRDALDAGRPANWSVNHDDLERVRSPFIQQQASAMGSTMPKIVEIWDRVRPLAKAWLKRALAEEAAMFEKFCIIGAKSQVQTAFDALWKALEAMPIKSGCGGPPHPSVNLDLLGIEIPFEPYQPEQQPEQKEEPNRLASSLP